MRILNSYLNIFKKRVEANLWPTQRCCSSITEYIYIGVGKNLLIHIGFKTGHQDDFRKKIGFGKEKEEIGEKKCEESCKKKQTREVNENKGHSNKKT